MPEPIRPEDHTLNGREPENHAALGKQLRADERHSFNTLALIEAIHQTFERDAEWLELETAFQVELAGYKADPNPPIYAERESKNTEAKEEGFWDRPIRSHSRQSDPRTEIDRLARLIVDGEYRRRANKGTEAERDG